MAETNVPKSQYFPDCFYRVSVKGLCVNEGKVLLLKESPEKCGKWELPGGGLDFGETIPDALRREIREETGFVVTHVFEKPTYIWTWKFENSRKMDWYYSLVVAYKIEIEDLSTFVPSRECEEWKFFGKEELKEIQLCHQTNGLVGLFNPSDFEAL